MRQLYLLLSGAVFFLCSCNCHEYIKCEMMPNFVYLSGYTSAEVDTVIVKRYTAGDSASQFVDSTIYKVKGYASAPELQFVGMGVDEGYEYDVFLVTPNRHYRISDVKSTGNFFEDKKHRCWGKQPTECDNYLASYRVDDVLTTIDHDKVYGYNRPNVVDIYLVK